MYYKTKKNENLMCMIIIMKTISSCLSCFIVVLYLNCLCANLAYGLPELNKLTYLLIELSHAVTCCSSDPNR